MRLSRNPTVKLRIFQAPNFFNSHFGALFVNSSYHLVVGPEKKKKCCELAAASVSLEPQQTHKKVFLNPVEMPDI